MKSVSVDEEETEAEERRKGFGFKGEGWSSSLLPTQHPSIEIT